MTCQEVTERLAAYLADDLPASERRTVAARLAACEECARYLRGYERTIALARAAYGDP